MNAHAAFDETTTTLATNPEADGRAKYLSILAALGGFAGRKAMLTRCKASGMSRDDAMCIEGALRMAGEIEVRLHTPQAGKCQTSYVKLPAAAWGYPFVPREPMPQRGRKLSASCALASDGMTLDLIAAKVDRVEAMLAKMFADLGVAPPA